jgi:hypothetical protein
MTGAMLATLGELSGAGGGGIPDGTIIYSTDSASLWSFTIPANVAYVQFNVWGPGGIGAVFVDRSGKAPIFTAGPGAGAGGYGVTHLAVTEGMTFSGTNGAGATATTAATASVLNANSGASLAAITANPGANATTSAAGAGGTSTGGSVSNTTGHAGGLVDYWDGGGSAPAFVDQTAQGTPATLPGGGSPGGFPQPSGANGRIQIIARTS